VLLIHLYLYFFPNEMTKKTSATKTVAPSNNLKTRMLKTKKLKSCLKIRRIPQPRVQPKKKVTFSIETILNEIKLG
jgi:hypothetical protein